MSTFYWAMAVLLLLAILAGLIRIRRGPTLVDGMLIVQLVGTAGVAVILVLAVAGGLSPLRDVALVFALLAAVTTVAFVRFGPRASISEDTDELE